MNINTMTRSDFEQLPQREHWDEEMECDAIVILPAKVSVFRLFLYHAQTWLSRHISLIREPSIYNVPGMHDSGYRLMDYVAVNYDGPMYRLAGGSDVLCLDGIGGYGRWVGDLPRAVPPAGWQMDCLPKSGLLRLWCKRRMLAGPSLSTFELYCK